MHFRPRSFLCPCRYVRKDEEPLFVRNPWENGFSAACDRAVAVLGLWFRSCYLPLRFFFSTYPGPSVCFHRCTDGTHGLRAGIRPISRDGVS